MPKRQFLKTDEPRNRLVIFSDGDQVFIEDTQIFQVDISKSDAEPVQDLLITGSREGVSELKELAKTNSIDIDTIKPTMNEQKSDNEQEMNDVDIS